ncbi:acyltransferase family protein [Simplicispira piscis]
MGGDKNIKYRADIDGLRAIAVSMVLAVHAFPKLLPNGYVGVDVFFVISGYLITSILLGELNQEKFSIRNFYIRRVNRIFPGLLLVLCFCIFFAPLVMYPDEYRLMGGSVLYSVFFAANINFYLEAGYWDIASKLKPLLHLWSLGVEEQFYLIWPLVLFLAHWKKRSVVATSLVILFGSLVVNLVLTSKSQPAGFYLPMGRFWELASGGLLACIQWRRENVRMNEDSLLRERGVQNALGWCGIGMLAATQWTPMHADAFPGFYVIAVVAATVMLMLAGPEAWFNRKVLSYPAVVYIGKISYPLYLWHWPLLVFARLIGDGQWTSTHRNLALLGAMVLAMLTYHCVERPLVKRVTHKNLLALVLLGLMVLMGMLAGLIYKNKLSLTPAPYANTPLLEYERPAIQSRNKVVLLGDSNAGHFSYGLSLLYGDRLETIATPGWPYLEGTKYREGYVPHHDHRGSPELTRQALARIESDPDVKLVILSNAYLMYLPADNIRSMERAQTETVAQAYEAGLRKTMERLLAQQKKIILVKSIPTYPMLSTVTACASEVRPAWRRQPADCIRDRDVVDFERREYDALVGRAVDGLHDVSIFNTLDELCDARYCYVNRNGILMYIDSGHFTTAGSQLMAAALARQIEVAMQKNH